MKLTTIWTIPAMALRERLRRTWDEWFLRGLAQRLPARLRFWVVVDAGANNMRNDVVPEVSFMAVLERMDNGR